MTGIGSVAAGPLYLVALIVFVAVVATVASTRERRRDSVENDDGPPKRAARRGRPLNDPRRAEEVTGGG